jgi:hypothetical protein
MARDNDDTMTAKIAEGETIFEVKPDGGDTWIAVEAPLDALKETGYSVQFFRAEKTDDGCVAISMVLKP